MKMTIQQQRFYPITGKDIHILVQKLTFRMQSSKTLMILYFYKPQWCTLQIEHFYCSGAEVSYCLLDFYGFETERCHNLKFFIINSSLLVFVSVYIHFGYSLERSKNQKIESNIGQIIRRVWLFLIKNCCICFQTNKCWVTEFTFCLSWRENISVWSLKTSTCVKIWQAG